MTIPSRRQVPPPPKAPSQLSSPGGWLRRAALADCSSTACPQNSEAASSQPLLCPMHITHPGASRPATRAPAPASAPASAPTAPAEATAAAATTVAAPAVATAAPAAPPVAQVLPEELGEELGGTEDDPLRVLFRLDAG